MPDGGEFVIGAENQTISAEPPSNLAELKPGEYVVVWVTDTGKGMPPEVLARAFEPFFTTKDVGEGTGLGLSSVYGFANQSGGHATIHSEPERGTTVRMYLPRHRKGDSPKSLLSEGGTCSDTTKCRILVVEDEPMVRAHVEKLLTRLGYDVTATADAREALAILSDDKKFDLLFTDVIMPGGMTGPQLGEAALKLSPTMKILFTSGYPAEAFKNLGLDDLSGVNFLAKPYRTAQLREQILKALTS